ncbi:hypothetical protein ZWY2020_007690 [Hordeum vulgare]|nr:hypothetical protein ZWY2020_007690 [Hordeum vulgare]
MDPKVLLDYINIWYEDPNTLLDDLKLPLGISHMVATFINEAKWKEQQAKQAKVELKTLADKYSKLSDRQSLKSNFIKLATEVVDNYNKKAAPRVPTPQPLIEEPTDETPQADEPPQAEEIPQESCVDAPEIEEITTENPADESAIAGETAPDPPAASKPADDFVPAGSSKPADESAEKTPSPKASKVKKMTPFASYAKKTRAAEKEAKKRKASSAEENTEAKRLKALDENAPLDLVPLNITPPYEMVTFEDQEKGLDEEMKDAASEEHTDEEFRIDDNPRPSIPQEDTAQGSTAPADASASVTKQAEEEQRENPQADEIQSPEKNPQNPQRDAPVDEIPQPDAQPDPIPQHEAQHEHAPQPEAQADEIPHPEDNAEENAPDQDNAFVVLNPETAIVVSPPVPQQNLQLMQRQPFSKRPQFQKENFFEERMYFIGENPHDKPQIRHLKFWMRTQLNYYASVLRGRNKIFQHRHIPHVELEAIPCLALVLNVLHEAGLLPMCSDISDWNSELILQFYATLHISGDPEDINTWVFDWMTQNTHYKAPATELLHELPVSIPSKEAVKLYGERELPNGMTEVHMKPLAKGQPPRKTFLIHELKYTTRVNKKTFEPIEGKGKSVIDEGRRPLDGQFREPEAYSSWDDTETHPPSHVAPRVMNTRELLLSLQQKVDRNHKWVKHQFGAIVKTLTETQNSMKLNHHYLHEVFDRTWATLAHLKTQIELEELEFERDFDWSWPPKKKFRPIPVPDLEDSSFSSFRTAESDEEQLDTATGPRKTTTPKKPRASSSTAKK